MTARTGFDSPQLHACFGTYVLVRTYVAEQTDRESREKVAACGLQLVGRRSRGLNRTTFRCGLVRTGDCSNGFELINRNEADAVRSSTMVSNIAERRLPEATSLRRRSMDLVEKLDHLAGISVMSESDRDRRSALCPQPIELTAPRGFVRCCQTMSGAARSRARVLCPPRIAISV